jgi:hypothetical protein
MALPKVWHVVAMDGYGFRLIEQPAYLPDIAPSDFHLFLKLKQVMIYVTYAVYDSLNGQEKCHWDPSTKEGVD